MPSVGEKSLREELETVKGQVAVLRKGGQVSPEVDAVLRTLLTLLALLVAVLLEKTTRKRVFFSFHYKLDNWRASQVRNIGKVEGNSPAADNDWETVTRGGDKAIKKWIDEQMYGKSCLVVLVGAKTAGRKWIEYEITKAWNSGKGVVGIHLNKLKNADGHTAGKGMNPFSAFEVNGVPMTQRVKCHTPAGASSGWHTMTSQRTSRIGSRTRLIRAETNNGEATGGAWASPGGMGGSLLEGASRP